MFISKHMYKVFRMLRRARPAAMVVGSGPTAGSPPVETRQATRREAVRSLIAVDAYRQQLAGDDLLLQQVLGGIELTLAWQFGRQMRAEPRQ